MYGDGGRGKLTHDIWGDEQLLRIGRTDWLPTAKFVAITGFG